MTVVAASLLLAVGTAPAGNRDAAATFDSIPGPAEVTFGKSISYRATLANGGRSTFTQVSFSMTRPTVTIAGSTTTLNVTLVYASCEANPYGPFAGLTSSEYACPSFPNLPAGAAADPVTLVWATPLAPEGATCDAGQCVLSTTGTWKIKESNGTTPSPDTFAKTVTNTLLAQPNVTKSGGYALQSVAPSACTVDSASVVTNQAVNAASNRIATAICAGELPGTRVDPGVAIEIVERPGGPNVGKGFTDVSSICIPAPGFVCSPDGAAPPHTFGDPLATFIFRIQETSDWPKGEKLDVAYHDDGTGFTAYTQYTCTFTRDGRTKIWTVVCPAAENGSWRFG